MVNRKSHYGWMALGGFLCLFGLVLACKLRDGNRALAQSDPVPPAPVNTKVEAPKPEEPPRVLPPIAAEGAPPPPVVAEPPPPPLPTLTPSEKETPPPPAVVTPPAPDPKPILIPASATVPAGPPDVPASSQPLPPIHVEKSGKASAPPAPPASPAVNPPVSVSPPPAAPSVEVPSEPPLAPTPGPVMQYRVHTTGETFKSLARKTLGSSERWGDIHKLNPSLRAEAVIPAGTMLRLPGDACVQDEGESVRPLPTLRPRPAPRLKSALPLTGTFSVTVDDGKGMTLPRVIHEQLANCETVLLSPGSDKCLWLTNQAHLDRLQAKLDKSPAREADVRGFKRLYYAQTVKAPVKDGRIVISDKLAAFAGLGAEVVLVGIDDHFEIWDAARWRKYTQAKKAAGFEE